MAILLNRSQRRENLLVWTFIIRTYYAPIVCFVLSILIFKKNSLSASREFLSFFVKRFAVFRFPVLFLGSSGHDGTFSHFFSLDPSFSSIEKDLQSLSYWEEEFSRTSEYRADSTFLLSHHSYFQNVAFLRGTFMCPTCTWLLAKCRAILNADRKLLRAIIDIARIAGTHSCILRGYGRKRRKEIVDQSFRDWFTSVKNLSQTCGIYFTVRNTRDYNSNILVSRCRFLTVCQQNGKGKNGRKKGGKKQKRKKDTEEIRHNDVRQVKWKKNFHLNIFHFDNNE